MIWPGQFKRPVMYYDDVVVAKSNKNRGKDNSDILGCTSLLLTQDDILGTTLGQLGAPSHYPSLSHMALVGVAFCRGAPQPTAESQQQLEKNPLEVSECNKCSVISYSCEMGVMQHCSNRSLLV